MSLDYYRPRTPVPTTVDRRFPKRSRTRWPYRRRTNPSMVEPRRRRCRRTRPSGTVSKTRPTVSWLYVTRHTWGTGHVRATAVKRTNERSRGKRSTEYENGWFELLKFRLKENPVHGDAVFVRQSSENADEITRR